MARSTFDFTSGKSNEDLNSIAPNFLTSNGFTLSTHNGEELFSKEVAGGLVPPQFIKLQIDGNSVHIEAFIKTLTGESGVTGIWGFASKRPLKKKVDELIERLK